MTIRERLTDAEYAAMADDYAAHPPRADEKAGPVWVNPGHPEIVLREGRPAGRKPAAGTTPTTSVRLPTQIRNRLATQAEAEAVKPAEIIRKALIEYFDRHTA